jgi:hypothetical protein
MSLEFAGIGLPLDAAGVSEVIDRMGVGKPELWAVLKIEAKGCGFLPDRRPVILYERHQFSKRTNHQFDSAHPDISNPNGGDYGAEGAHQYDRLHRAINLNREAALDSTSWGIGQLMGFNAEISGYSDVEAMVTAMTQSENDQLLGMTGEIMHGGLDKALREHRWADFALGYNGVNYAENQYDTRLAAAYHKYAQGGLPDLTVRAVQVYLMYLGFKPGPVDGLPGNHTFGALNKFQQQNNLPISNEINDEVASLLKEKALANA